MKYKELEEFTDIYFLENYYKLFEENGDGDFSFFEFKESDKIAFYPFLISSINETGAVLDSQYFDIQGAYGYNGIVSNSNDPLFIERFYEAFDEYCRLGKIVAEFSRFHPVLGNEKFSQKNMNVIFDRETVVLDLNNSYENFWKNSYSSKNRNVIRKARKTGYSIQVVPNPSFSEIERFVSIYHYSMKATGADEYFFFSPKFFHNTFKYLEDRAVLFNVLNFRKEVVCTAIFLRYGDFFHYHLSGRNQEADNTVNNFLLDEAIRFAHRKGAKIFHFGGGRSSDPGDSLLKFKSSFSKQRLPFYIGKKIHNQDVYDEVVKQWEARYPNKKEKYKNHLLKYRF